MAKQKTALDDERYYQFCAEYQDNLKLFAERLIEADHGHKLTWQQEKIIDAIEPKGAFVSVSSGHGCFGLGTEIMLSTGKVVPVEDIKPGDRLMGDDGCSERNVLALRRGRENMYRFTYRDNTSHVFNESHILCLVATNTKGRRIAGNKTTVTVREWLGWGEDKKRCHAIYRSGVTDFGSDSDLPMPAYIFGAWLGDGTSKRPAITTMDDEIKDEIYGYAASIGCRVSIEKSTTKGKAKTYHIVKKTKSKTKNPMTAVLDDLNVTGNKHIPDCYLYSSLENRKQLLAGLIDTDGSLDGASYDFVQKSERLARQTAWLARSIGCHSTIKETKKKCYNNGVIGTYWRVTIGRNTDNVPVKIERKKRPDTNHQRRNLNFGIKSVEPLGEGDYYGFELDGNNKFLGGDFTVLHNTGKSDATGIIALHFVICHPESLVMLTANNIDQVLNVIFAYLKKHWRNLCKLEPWLEQYFIITDKFFYAKGFKREWQIFGKTASPGKEEGLAGLHNKNYLIICDEASALEKKAYTTIVGGLTEENNKLLLISQYTRPSGAFADSQTIMAKQGPDDERGIFDAIQLNSELSPLVTPKWIRDRRVEYGGVDDPEYGIRVLGICPDNVAGFLISRSLAASGYDNKIKHVDDWGYLGTVDVATSGLRDKTEVTIAKVSGRHSNRRVETIFRWTAPVGMTGKQVAYELESMGMAYQNITWVIDAGGYGASTCEEAEDIGLIVKRVYWGNQVHSNTLKKRYFNQRAYANLMVRDALTTKRLLLFSPTRKDRDTTLDQMSKLPYEFNGESRWQMVSKKIMREKHGIKSPDIPDTYAFFWLAEPIPAGEDITGEENEDPFENALGGVINA